MLRLSALLTGFILMLCALGALTGCTLQPVTPVGATPAASEESAAPTPNPTAESSPFDAEILKNLEYNLGFDGTGPVQLSAGVYKDDANQVAVNWVDTYALGELNGEAAAAVVLLANFGGSGTFSVLAVVQEQDGAPVNVASTTLGDRVTLNWVTIANDAIKLDLVTQGPDEPMCCGTQRTMVEYTLADNMLTQSDAAVIGVQPQITGTQIITYVPTVIPTASQKGSCFVNAIGLGRADAWRCTTDDNLIYDPCFALDTTGATPTVICGADPLMGEDGFVLELTEPLPAPDAGNAAAAWIVQLGDGTICSLLTGTVPGVGDQVAPYGCADEAHSNLMQDFIIYDTYWYAQSAVFDLGDNGFVIQSSVRTPVAKVWR